MREIRQSGSEGGATQHNAPSLPLSAKRKSRISRRIGLAGDDEWQHSLFHRQNALMADQAVGVALPPRLG